MNTRFDAAPATLHGPGSEYPIELLARSRSTRFQMGFARMTIHLAPAMKDVALEADHDGLRILASSEIELALPGEVVRQIHGDDVEFGAPRVRYLAGEQPQEPVMWVRICLQRQHAEPVLHDLVTRTAAIDEVDRSGCRPVIRARAPLRVLLGYPRALATLTRSAADLSMWLSHYVAVPPDPGRAA